MLPNTKYTHDTLRHQLKHFAYAGGREKMEPPWNVIKFRHLDAMRPLLETILSKVSGTEPNKGVGALPVATDGMLLKLIVLR